MFFPYMLVGARQTGKTYILTEFCKNEFQNYVYINLENMTNIAKIFEETMEPEKIIQTIEITLNISIDINNTIIFFDEIQTSEKAINSLKYFAEAKEAYKIVCAGSLLGVKINRFKSSFPVGKVWIDYLYPMDFEEFLIAIGEEKLNEKIKNSYKKMEPMLETLHQKATGLYNEYLCIGGMPGNIIEYIRNDKNIKASDNTTSKSLNYYIERYKPKYSIRISAKNFGFNNNIKSIPLYAVHLI